MSKTYSDLINTNFPDSNQTFISYEDITSVDGTILKSFKQAIELGNIDLAQSIIQSMPNYRNKIITSKDLNTLTDTIEALERLYGSDIETIIESKQAEWQKILDQFEYKGQWSNTNQYIRNNMVSFTDVSKGINFLYICIASKSNIGIDPLSDTVTWLQLTIQGNTGESGSSGTFGFDWNSNTSYNRGTIVAYDNSWWFSKVSNTNQVPYIESNYWELVMDYSPKPYPVQPDQPIDQAQQINDIWFKTEV